MADRRVPISLRLPPDVLERLRAAVYWVGRGLTVTGILEDAAGKALERLEAQYQREHGKKIPPRPKK